MKKLVKPAVNHLAITAVTLATLAACGGGGGGGDSSLGASALNAPTLTADGSASPKTPDDGPALAPDAAVAQIRSEGGDAHSLAFDLMDEAAVTAAVPKVVERHGRLDVLLNNAGICLWSGLLESTLDTGTARSPPT